MAKNSGSLLKRLIVIVGPTAVGKSDVALNLAPMVSGEIVSIDSMQIYRGMDIGTAKASLASRALIPHHLIDIANPDENFSVAKFQTVARDAIGEIISRKRIPILVGGSGLHLRAVVDDLRFPSGDFSSGLREELISADPKDLYAKLVSLDRKAAKKIDPKNQKRIIRALEAVELSGSFSQNNSDWTDFKSIYNNIYFFGISIDRVALYAKIEERVDQMFESGLIKEVRGLLDSGSLTSKTALQAISYKETLSYLRGEIGRDEAAALIKKRTRNFAKRQYTWFNRDPRIKWISGGGLTPIGLAEMIAANLTHFKEPIN